MKKSLHILLALMSLSLMLSACGKKKDSNDATVVAARDGRVGTGSGGGALPSGQQYVPGTEASVYTDPAYAAQFNESIKVLVSATMDPKNVGTVDYKNGVKIKGAVVVSQTGSIDPANSKIELTIQDDLKNSDGDLYEPIVITVLGASGTAVNGTVNLTFSDQYGSILLTGTYDNSTYHGVVNFQNNRVYNGKSSGTLGKFEIPVCGFFKCN